jgi:hypothetical protein
VQTPGDERPVLKSLFLQDSIAAHWTLSSASSQMNMGICPVCHLHSAPEAEIRVLILVFNHVLAFDTDQTKMRL